MASRGLRVAGAAAPRLGLRRSSAGPMLEQPEKFPLKELAKEEPKTAWRSPEVWQVCVALGGLGVALGGLAVAYHQARIQQEQSRIQQEKSHPYIIGRAVATIVKPFAPSPNMPGHHIVERDEHKAIKKRLAHGCDGRTTIIGGQFQVGKTSAVENALDGEKGVVKVTVDTNGWKLKLYKKVGLDDNGMFVEALREANKQLDKPALLYLDVPRYSTANLSEISTFCKELVTDEKVARGVVVASQLSVALGFDAGGKERQFDIWVAPMTDDEAREYLSNNFPKVQKADAERIIAQVGTNTGAMGGVASDITEKEMNVDKALEVRRRLCKEEVDALLAIQIQGRDQKYVNVGREIAQALLKEGSGKTIDHGQWARQGLPVQQVAAGIKEERAFAVSFHTENRVWHFASPMHERAAQEAGMKG